MVKRFVKIIISLCLLIVSIFLILYALDSLHIINLNLFNDFNQSQVGQKLLEWQNYYGFRYNMVLCSSIILFTYISIWIFLGSIPFGKVARFIINFLIGGFVTFSCIILIVVGAILMSTM